MKLRQTLEHTRIFRLAGTLVVIVILLGGILGIGELLTSSASTEIEGRPSLVPAITATLTDSFADADMDGKAGPGETVTYTATINNSGTTAATGVQFSDTLDAVATLVPGSFHASPIASDETFSAVGNTLLEVGVAASGFPAVSQAGSVLSNDTAVTDTISVVSNTSPTGGSVTLNANGTFSYLPNLNFAGPDTFTYTIRNDAAPTLTDTATVTINVASKVWYVNNSGANGNGCSNSPFNNLTSANTASGTGDIIFVHRTGTNYNPGITLKNNQQLIGQGVNLVVNTFTLVAATSNPVISPGGSNGINLASGNTVRGLTVGNTGSGIGITGNSVGTLTISNTTINGTGEAIDINGGSLNVTLDSLASTNSSFQGIDLNNVSGSFTVSGGTTITNSGSTGVDLTSSAGATFTFGDLDITTANDTGLLSSGGTINSTSGTISTGFGRGVDISNTTLGISLTSVTSTGGLRFNGNSGTFTCNGGTVSASTGSTITIDGGSATYNLNNMAINRLFGRVLTVGGTTAAGGVISFGGTSVLTASGGDYGVRVDGSSAAITIATLNINAPVVSIPGTYNGTTGRPTNDGNGDGVFLKNNTGSFTVNGGTIENIPDNAFDIRNSSNTVINGVSIPSTTNSGIQWYQGSSLSFLNSTMVPGNNTAVPTAGINIQDSGIRALDVSGNLVLGNSCQIGPFPGYVFANASAGSEDRAVELDNDTGTNMNVTVTGCTFTGSDFQGLNLRHIGGSLDAVIGGPNAADQNTFQNINGAAIDTGPAQQSANGNLHGLRVENNQFTTVGIGISVFSARGNSIGGVEGTHAFITDNIINGTTSDAIRLNAFAAGTSLGNNPIFRALVTGNTITGVANQLNNQGGGSAFFVAAEDNADSDVTIDSNPTVTGGTAAPNNFAGAITTQNQRSGDLDLVLTNNDFNNFSTGAANGFGVGFFGQDLVVPGTQTAIRFGGNDWHNQISGFFETVFFDAGIGTMDVQGFPGPSNCTNVANYLNMAGGDTNVSFFGFCVNSGTITGGAASVIPPTPLPLTPLQGRGSPAVTFENRLSVFADSENLGFDFPGNQIGIPNTKREGSEVQSKSDTENLASISDQKSNNGSLWELVTSIGSLIVPTVYAEEGSIAPTKLPNPAPMAGETVTTGTFNLPAGKSVTIMFQATTPLFNGQPQMMTQGTVSGTNFATVMTDDPGTAAVFGDPTVTPLALTPTAAAVNISGRAVSASGRGLENVRVMISGGELTQPRFTQTNPFGYYRFVGLPAGNTYLITVSSKRYEFEISTRLVNVDDDIVVPVFIGQP